MHDMHNFACVVLFRSFFPSLSLWRLLTRIYSIFVCAQANFQKSKNLYRVEYYLFI